MVPRFFQFLIRILQKKERNGLFVTNEVVRICTEKSSLEIIYVAISYFRVSIGRKSSIDLKIKF